VFCFCLQSCAARRKWRELAKKAAKHSDATMTGILATRLKMGQIDVEDLVEMAAGMIRKEGLGTRLRSSAGRGPCRHQLFQLLGAHFLNCVFQILSAIQAVAPFRLVYLHPLSLEEVHLLRALCPCIPC